MLRAHTVTGSNLLPLTVGGGSDTMATKKKTTAKTKAKAATTKETIGSSPHPVDRTIGERLRAMREANGFGVRQAAAMMGVAHPTVVAWESGRQPVRLRDVVALAGVYGDELDGRSSEVSQLARRLLRGVEAPHGRVLTPQPDEPDPRQLALPVPFDEAPEHRRQSRETPDTATPQGWEALGLRASLDGRWADAARYYARAAEDHAPGIDSARCVCLWRIAEDTASSIARHTTTKESAR